VGSSPLRVVHVDSAHEWRGSQNQLLLTALGMASRGHYVGVACQAGGRLEARAREAGLRVHPLSFGGDLFPRAILGLARVLRDESPDVVHAHDPHATGAGVFAVRLRSGARLVASRRVPLPLNGRLSRRKYAACDRVVAVSRAVARALLQDGLPASRVGLVHEGVPDRREPQDGGRVLAELGVPPGCPVIGNVAALTEHKDHETLLVAMQWVLRTVPDARLVIVGEGPLRSRLEARARTLGLGGRCVFAGFRTDVDRLVATFSLMCLTSAVEGLGTSLLDAMCFARPIVATATGGIPEVVRDGKTGLLVPVGHPSALAVALVDLLLDPDRREAMGRAGRRCFEERFTASRMVDETLGVYDELLRSAAPAPRRADLEAAPGRELVAAALAATRSCSLPPAASARER
jgi:L-malate glycosyltransferase